MRDLNELVVGFDDLVVHGTRINNTGRIVCGAETPGHHLYSVVLDPLPPKIGDIDGNCKIDVDDLLSVINDWGKAKSAADINLDSIVNGFDLQIVLENWTF